MKRKLLPLTLILIAGLVTAVITFIQKTTIVYKLVSLLIVFVVFYIIGSVIVMCLDHFDKVNRQKELEEAEAARKAAEELAATIVTSRRIQKEILKLIDDNIIPENWDEKSLGVIAKNLPRAVYNDCVKEEPETVSQIEDFGKICGSLTMKLAREMIK
jgi:large-conductance mechanosensitive channel